MGRYLNICDEMMRDRWAKRAASLLALISDDELRAGLRDRFEERAGICEHDGGLSRDESERLAFEEIQGVISQG